MEFLLQLMAELFGTETEQQKFVTVAETSNKEFLNAEIINPFQCDEYENDPDFQLEDGLIFDFIRFH
jgi:hypothetical protein